MRFLDPGYLWLLLLLVPLVGWYVWQLWDADASLQVSGTGAFHGSRRGWRTQLVHLPMVLRLLVLALLIVALARPQLSNKYSKGKTEGIDIMMALDVSGTMQTNDFTPDRLEAAKKVAAQFISSRPDDNIGLVVFAGESFCQCPLTIDHQALIQLFRNIRFGMVEDGTAIGNGLATCLNRLKQSKAKSKVVILLTDGSNNAGDIDPQTAADIAQSMGIRVYTIGVGSHGKIKIPYQTAYGVEWQEVDNQFDEVTLQKIAQTTGGRYFRATDNESLSKIYSEIDKMEKTKLQVQKFDRKEEHFILFAGAALALLLLEMLLRHWLLKSVVNS